MLKLCRFVANHRNNISSRSHLINIKPLSIRNSNSNTANSNANNNSNSSSYSSSYSASSNNSTSSTVVVGEECKLEFLSGEDNAGIAVLSLSRESAKNALGRKMMREMVQHVAQVRFSHSSAARVLIIRRLVPKVFCAGADLKERAQMTQQEAAQFVNLLRTTFTDIENLPMPTIACIQGAALGGGLELALACDMRVAQSEGTLLGLTETSLAIIPGAGGTQRLPRIVGMAKAKELIYTARRFGAADALQLGLVNYSVNEAYEKSLQLAREILPNGPIAVRVAKVAVQEGMQMDKNSGMVLEQQCYAQVIPSNDRLEGLQAFREKRKPQYKGE